MGQPMNRGNHVGSPKREIGYAGAFTSILSGFVAYLKKSVVCQRWDVESCSRVVDIGRMHRFD